MQPTMLKSANGLEYGYMVWTFGHMSSFVARKGNAFSPTLTINCKFQATCCAIMFGSRVLRSLDCRSVTFSNHAEKVLQGPFKT
uniref:Uncharacterized protein n=1 Tax=Rhipicephalus zambeziensis TaxID=60191 RepID=A0A224YJY4_9ACAR